VKTLYIDQDLTGANITISDLIKRETH